MTHKDWHRLICPMCRQGTIFYIDHAPQYQETVMANNCVLPNFTAAKHGEDAFCDACGASAFNSRRPPCWDLSEQCDAGLANRLEEVRV